MKLHERTFIVQRAQFELDEFITNLIQRHSLTCGELTGIIATSLQQWAKWQVRDERTSP